MKEKIFEAIDEWKSDYIKFDDDGYAKIDEEDIDLLKHRIGRISR